MPFRYILIPLALGVLLGSGPALAAAPAEAPAVQLAYALKPGEPLRYKLTANIHYNGPFQDNPDLVDWHIVINLVYRATPKARLADGTADVDFRAESADVTVEKVPLPLPLKDVQDVLDQTATLSSAGEVKNIVSGKPLPFSMSVPGVDPKRLFLLLFPIVFQPQPVRVGDNWSFQSALLGGEGANATFTATMLPPSDTSKSGRRAPKPDPAVSSIARLREEFRMAVDQKLDADHKPITDDIAAYRTRQGKIEGNGVFAFDRSRGRFTNGVVNIKADLVDNLVGKPATEDTPKQITSKVDATVTLQLQPPASSGGAATARKDK